MIRVRGVEANDSNGMHAFETFDSHPAICVSLFGSLYASRLSSHAFESFSSRQSIRVPSKHSNRGTRFESLDSRHSTRVILFESVHSDHAGAGAGAANDSNGMYVFETFHTNHHIHVSLSLFR